MKTLLTTLAFVLNIVFPLALQIWDRRRLTPRQRARSWNGASWGSALYGFGWISMIAWVWVTRNEWARWRRRGLGAALGWSALVLLVGAAIGVLTLLCVGGAVEGVAALLGVPGLD
jgi:hypothetical protein